MLTRRDFGLRAAGAGILSFFRGPKSPAANADHVQEKCDKWPFIPRPRCFYVLADIDGSSHYAKWTGNYEVEFIHYNNGSQDLGQDDDFPSIPLADDEKRFFVWGTGRRPGKRFMFAVARHYVCIPSGPNNSQARWVLLKQSCTVRVGNVERAMDVIEDFIAAARFPGFAPSLDGLEIVKRDILSEDQPLEHHGGTVLFMSIDKTCAVVDRDILDRLNAIRRRDSKTLAHLEPTRPASASSSG